MTQVTISAARLRELEDAQEQLQALEAGGVGNWEWYDESMRPYRVRKEQEEKWEELVEEILEALCTEIDQPAGQGCGYGFTEKGSASLQKILQNIS